MEKTLTITPYQATVRQRYLSAYCLIDIYLLLTEFESRSVNNGPRFSPSISIWPKGKVRGPYVEWEKQGPVIYSTDRENEVSKIFTLSLYLEVEHAGREGFRS